MEDHRVDLVCSKRLGRGSAPQEKSDWASRRGRIQTRAAYDEQQSFEHQYAFYFLAHWRSGSWSR